uniref:Uncharacterized protein n=1 Tax=Arundo donax TaxID=35708 RepID=A0A0A9F8E9_ARUDO
MVFLFHSQTVHLKYNFCSGLVCSCFSFFCDYDIV